MQREESLKLLGVVRDQKAQKLALVPCNFRIALVTHIPAHFSEQVVSVADRMKVQPHLVWLLVGLDFVEPEEVRQCYQVVLICVVVLEQVSDAGVVQTDLGSCVARS